MKKIPSLFQRNYDTDRLVRDEVVPGSEWVLNGEGRATVKFDGTACMVCDGKLYRRYDRKLTKKANRAKKQGAAGPWSDADLKPAPDTWEPCEPEPNRHTGHWPGWLPIGDEPESKWYRHAWEHLAEPLAGGTYELIGKHFQGNPYQLQSDVFVLHGLVILDVPILTYDGIRQTLAKHRIGTLIYDGDCPRAYRLEPIEGIVWHHPDGRMVKIKRRDFGLPWPPETTE